jgi:nucleoside 2-deoxyribosyltransferase
MPTCPICKLSDDNIVEKTQDLERGILIECPRCKKFTITHFAMRTGPQLGSKLSAWVRDRNERSDDIPQITTDILKELQTGLPDYTPRQKQIILLQNIERKTEYPGKGVLIVPDYDTPLAWASTREEFVYYMESLIGRGLLKVIDSGGVAKINDLIFSAIITADGWDYLEKQERHIEERTQAFVAMSFSEDLKSFWEGPISNAIKRAGYKPCRVDAGPHSDRIDVKIIAEIKNSRFLIADFTEHKQGVYFEAGYALGLGLPVIWCVRKDHLEKAHFDTRQYNHIVWETKEELENQLYNFICVIIGRGKEV